MTVPAPELSVIIISHGHEQVLPACVASLAPALDGLTSEVIVLDNLQGGGVARTLCGQPVRLLQNPAPRGFAHNVNRAAAAASGRCLLLLNPDTRHAAGHLADAVAFLDMHPEVGVVGCTLLNPDGSAQQSYRCFPTLRVLAARGLGADHWPWQPQFYRRGLMADERWPHPWPVDWVFGAFMLVRKAEFDRLGGMDESFRLYYEDVDLCKRFGCDGLATYVVPGVQFMHEHARASAARPFSKTWRWHVSSAARYFWKNARPGRRRVG